MWHGSGFDPTATVLMIFRKLVNLYIEKYMPWYEIEPPEYIYIVFLGEKRKMIKKCNEPMCLECEPCRLKTIIIPEYNRITG